MRLTTKGRYAVTAMLDLALHNDRGAVALADIAKSQHISLSYLEQLFAKLRQAELVRGIRGPGGGYHLARPPEEISIAAIISAVDERVDITNCRGDENCHKGERCLTHQLWEDLSDQLHTFLAGITLRDAIGWPNVRQVAERQDALTGRDVNIPVNKIQHAGNQA
ncbi:MAG: HTH-type transcriptional regulator IscR [Gammaproteobacteria bacterium]|nr:HTH-type transcriptional regulator IscR [Gammaproteobacteria bacterium]